MPGNILFITIIAIITHGWIFLSNAEIWDGWYVRDWIKNGHLDYLSQYYQEAGHPFFGWVHLHANWFSNVSFFYHFLAFGSILGTALGMYWILNKRNLLTPNSRLWTAIFMVCYPGFLVSTDSVVTLYLVCYFLFILGWCFFIKATLHDTKKKYFFHFFALSLFFLSFFTNSLLVFYFGFLIIWFLLDFKNIKTSLVRYWIYIVWPLTFWSWSKLFITRTQVHLDYYQLRLNPAAVIQGFRDFYFNIIRAQIDSLFRTGLLIPILILVAYGYFFKKQRPSRFHRSVALAGFFLLICAIFPYTVVNQSFGLSGWVSKNNLLLALPLSLILIGIVDWAAPIDSRLRLIIPGLIVVACIFVQVRNYFRLQAVEAKLQALSHALKDVSFSIAYLDDQFFIRGSESWFPPSIYTSAVRMGMGMEPANFLILSSVSKNGYSYSQDEIEQSINDTFIPYAFSSVNRQGNQIKVRIAPGETFQRPESFGAKYLWFRVTKPSSELKKFLTSYVSVKVSQ